MAWAKFDDRFPSHRKVRPLTDAAFRLHVSAVCWSNEQLTDGLIQQEELDLVSDVRKPRPAAEELVRRGLWELVDSGWQIHDYHDHNPTREEVLTARDERHAAKVRAGRAGGLASGAARRGTKQQASTRQADNEADGKQAASKQGKQNEAPARPVPTSGYQGSTPPDPNVRARRSTTDDRVRAGLDLAAKYDQIDEHSRLRALPGGAA